MYYMPWVSLTRKAFGGLPLPTVLWTSSTQVCGIVSTYARGQRSTSWSHFCSLSCYGAVRHGHLPVTWRGVSMFLVPIAFAGSWGTARVTVSNLTTPWNRVKAFYHHSPWTPPLAIWACVCPPDVDPAHKVLSVRDNPVWGRPREHPHNSRLGKINQSYWDLFGMKRMAAWWLVRRDLPGWKHWLSHATCPYVYSHWWSYVEFL